MQRICLTPPGEAGVRGARARLYLRWMPRLGAEPVALYELLRTLPEVGVDAPELEELAELLRSTPESVERSLRALGAVGFLIEHEGWVELAERPPTASSAPANQRRAVEANIELEPAAADGSGAVEVVRASDRTADRVADEASGEYPVREDSVSPEDYFRYMGTLPSPHILEFLNGYTERDGLTADAIREALRISCERDARKVGYVRSILERWVERGVRTVEDVGRFEEDRKLKLVAEGGRGVNQGRGEDRPAAAGRKEGYKWFFGE